MCPAGGSVENKARSQQELKISARNAPALHGVKGQLAVKSEPLETVEVCSGAYEYNSPSLNAFISAVEGGIEILRETQLSSHQRALRVLSLLKELIRGETGSTDFEDGIRIFFHRLGHSASMAALLPDLYRRTRAVLYFSSRRKASLGFEAERVADELSLIADWYAKRKRSLAHLRAETGREDAFLRSGAQLFDLELIQDCVSSGSAGVQIHGSLCLCGFSNQVLWVRVSVRDEDGFVRCRPGWQVWSEGAEELFLMDGSAPRAFAAVAPLYPEAERVIVDSFKIFLPLSALDLPAGTRSLSFEVELSDQQGCVISRSLLDGEVSIPPVSEHLVCPPSPQALGIWPEDFVRGDRVSDLRIGRGFRGILDRGSEVFSVVFDLDLHAHAGERLEAQCRFLDSAGYLVESCAAVLRDSSKAFVSHLALYPAVPAASYYGLEMQIPLSCLRLEEGLGELFCEIAVVNQTGRVLCGAIQQLDYDPVAAEKAALTERRPLSKPFVSDPCAEVELSEFVLDPAWHFDGHDTIRLKAVFSSEKWSVNPCRVVFSIEGPGGEKLLSASVTDRWGGPAELVQCLCLGGYDGPGRQELVVNFDPDELPQHVFGRGSAEAALIARLRLYALDDRLQIETAQEFDFRSSEIAERLEAEKSGQISAAVAGDDSGGPRRHNSLEHDAFIADILSRAYPVAGEVRFEVALNVNYLSRSSEEFLLYYEILDRNGNLIGQGSDNSVPSGLLTGCMKRVDVSQLTAKSLHSSGWYQVPVVLDLKLETIVTDHQPLSLKDIHTVRVMLFTANGTLLQVACGGSSMLTGLDVYIDGNLSNEKRSIDHDVGAFLERIMPTIFGNRSNRKQTEIS